MSRKLFILLMLSATVHLFAGAGIASDAAESQGIADKAPALREEVLALFIDALLEKDAEKQCNKLLNVIEKDPDNAHTPFQAFRTAFLRLKNKRGAVLEKFNALWRKKPDHILISLHGGVINRACGVSSELLLKRLAPLQKYAPEQLISHKLWKKEYIFMLLSQLADAMLETGRHEELIALFQKWYNAPAPYRTAASLALAEYCYTGAARSFAAGARSRGQRLERCFNDASAVIEKAEKSITDRKMAAALLVFHSNFRQINCGRAMIFAREYDRRIHSTESNLWRLSTAVECGSLEDFNQAAALITEINPRFDSTELRFKTLLNAGKFDEAEKTLRRLPEKHHFDMMCLLYTHKKEWKKLHTYLMKHLRAGTPPDLRIGHLLLAISEKIPDASLFGHAEKILTPHLKYPGIANAVGYVSAILDLNLPRARKLLEYALKKEPANVAFLDSMAWIAFKQKRYAEAEKWINKALALLNPREGIATILEHAGDIAAAQGKSPRHFYELSLKYAPFEKEFETAPVMKKLEAVK